MWGTAQHTCSAQSSRRLNRLILRPPTVRHGCRAVHAAGGSTAGIAHMLEQLPTPPVPYLAGHEIGSFAHGTISKRLPAIVNNIVAEVKRYAEGGDEAVMAESAAIMAGLEAMAEEMRSNAPMLPVSPPPGSDATFAQILQITNACLEREQASSSTPFPTWWGFPWLLVECYMYVRISALLRSHPRYGPSFDPFNLGKVSAFTQSAASVADIGIAVTGLLGTQPEWGSEDMRKRLFEVMQYSLWGNKTDLSMLVDVAKLDNSNMAAQISDGGSHPFLIVDDFDAVWSFLAQPKSGPRRLDLVLDNAGLELYGDLCLADVLTEFGVVDEVVLHGKLLPWFVSDVMAKDLSTLLELCGQQAVSAKGAEAVQKLGGRWQGHVSSGRWRYQDHWFWTTPCPFWWMEQVSPDLYRHLQSSFLVVFKGDLNYRKLAFDCRWPVTTPFHIATGPFHPAPFVSLRTLKADVMAGLREGQGEQLDGFDKDWMVNGKFGIIQARM